jgi:hypothetical protein
LNFKHNNHWHRIIVGFDLGSCNPICFQTRGLKGAKMNISANYMAILFFIWFDVFINEVLSKIPFRNMHGNYYQDGWWQRNRQHITWYEHHFVFVVYKGYFQHHMGGSMSYVVTLPNNSYKPNTFSFCSAIFCTNCLTSGIPVSSSLSKT